MFHLYFMHPDALLMAVIWVLLDLFDNLALAPFVQILKATLFTMCLYHLLNSQMRILTSGFSCIEAAAEVRKWPDFSVVCVDHSGIHVARGLQRHVPAGCDPMAYVDIEELSADR
ncbi:hypothetical protein FRC02_001974 [Tulasnella sp. 418]|nr:hypothetical protein FRC02_001974 [Tulasnella sp. 418]